MKQNFFSKVLLAFLPLGSLMPLGVPGLTTQQTQPICSEQRITAPTLTTDKTDLLMNYSSIQKNTETIGAKEVSKAETLHKATPAPTASPVVVQKQNQQETIPAAVPITNPITAPEELDALFEKYASEYGVSSTVLKHIAKCESHFNPAALSKNGLYGGMFQYSAPTWSSTRKAMGLDENPELRFNAEEAIRTSAFKIGNGGIGAWPTCGKKAIASQR